MRIGKNRLYPRIYSKFSYSAGTSMLLIFLMGFVFQGCVIHNHDTHNTRTKTYSGKNYPQHKHKDTRAWKPAPTTVDEIPSYEEQHPSHTHQPPSHAKAYEVAQGRPFTEEEHPASHGQGHEAKKEKPYKGDEHPSLNAQSGQGQGQSKRKGKPDKGEDHPSSHGKKGNMGQGKPEKGLDHPSAQAKNKQDLKHGPDKNKPLWGLDESPSIHAKNNMGYQGGDTGRNRPSLIEEDILDYQGEPAKGKDRPFAHAKMENIQIAKAEKGRGKNNSKSTGKTNKTNRGKHKQLTDATAEATHQEPSPGMAPAEATIASFEPLVFDDSERNIIQSYYRNSKSSSPSKGKGRKRSTRGSKRNNTDSIAKNGILTQPTQPLPQDLESQLPPAPPNSKRAFYNQQVLLIEKGTNRVLDVINVSH